MVALREFTTSDIPRLLSWIDGPEALALWSGKGFTWPLDEAQLVAHAASASPTQRIWAVHAAPDEVVGHVELLVDPVHRVGRLGRVLVAPAARGRGLGAATVRAALRVAFDERGMHRVGLGVFTHNPAAIRLYERLGFVREGVLREVVCVNGGWWSSIEMGMLEGEWRAGTGS
jgi:RimJ/RimL family protein N-acetyltransferase